MIACREGFALSWVSDLSSVLGIPAGAATLAAAIYAGCAAAQKAASVEVLDDIGRVLSNRSWSDSARPPALIGQIFEATFGERHLSLRCALASAIASFYIVITLMWLVNRLTGNSFMGYNIWAIFSDPIGAIQAWVGVFIATFIPDYIALGKTRFLTRVMKHVYTVFGGLFLVGLDIVLSGIISLGAAILLLELAIGAFRWLPSFISESIFGTLLSPATMLNMMEFILLPNAHVHLSIVTAALADLLAPFNVSNGVLPMFSVACWSTLLTSVWTLLMLLSGVAIKIVIPLQCFITYFFDIKHRPLEAIGIVSGALVMIGSLIWTVLRAVF
jgi:hypothetical protein